MRRISSLSPLAERITTTSPFRTAPRSPCTASAGFRKWLGVPVLLKLAESLRATCPALPTPVVQTRITPPASRMGPADDIEGKAKASPLWAKYGQRVDNNSAREMLAARIAQPAAPAAPAQPAGEAQPQARPAAAAHKRAAAPAAEHKEAASAMAGGVAAVTAFLGSREGKQIQKEVVRGVFGLLKKRL